ncbi:MAG TPA: DUF5678 domain-containing protein [Thermoanaerobaculia bacterium]|jgi:hypothetical protein
MTTLPQEFNWYVAHPEISARYAGEYIAIVGEAVVAHGKDLKFVLEEARKHGKPFIHKVRRVDKELVV